MPFTAPFRLNLSPGSQLTDGSGNALDLSISCGADWSLTVPFVGADGVTPISLSGPQMQIRLDEPSTSPLILTPTLAASGNTITITIPGSATKAVTARNGNYDLFATRTDTSGSVKLLYGAASFVAATTALA